MIVSIASGLSRRPRAVLSAIVVDAVWKLMDFAALRRYARLRRNDIVAAVVAAVGAGIGAVRPAAGGGRVSAGPNIGRAGRRRGRARSADVKAVGAASAFTRSARRSRVIGALRIDVPIFWVTRTLSRHDPRQGRVCARTKAPRAGHGDG